MKKKYVTEIDNLLVRFRSETNEKQLIKIADFLLICFENLYNRKDEQSLNAVFDLWSFELLQYNRYDLSVGLSRIICRYLDELAKTSN